MKYDPPRHRAEPGDIVVIQHEHASREWIAVIEDTGDGWRRLRIVLGRDVTEGPATR